MKTLGKYEFVYENGFIQIKYLISKEVFEEYMKLKKKESDLKNLINNFKRLKKSIPDDIKTELEQIHIKLLDYPESFFVVGGPMHTALVERNGQIKILDKLCGNYGVYMVKIREI